MLCFRFQEEATVVKEKLTKEEKAAQDKKELEAKLAELQRKAEQLKKEEEELKKKERVCPNSHSFEAWDHITFLSYAHLIFPRPNPPCPAYSMEC